MLTVYQWLDRDGQVVREQVEEQPDHLKGRRPYGSIRRICEAHRVIVDGRVIKNNCGPR